jgi:hypothetical protein
MEGSPGIGARVEEIRLNLPSKRRKVGAIDFSGNPPTCCSGDEQKNGRISSNKIGVVSSIFQ